jgi:hypothetical protein
MAEPATIDPDDREWLAAVGLLAVYWADLEIVMDTYIATMIVHPSTYSLGDPSVDTDKALDITFNRRIRMWKDAVALLPVQEDLKRESLEVADRARNARNHRDILLHGETRRDAGGRMTANHLPRKRGQKVQYVPYPPEKVLKIAGEILDIQASVTDLVIRTIATLLK